MHCDCDRQIVQINTCIPGLYFSLLIILDNPSLISQWSGILFMQNHSVVHKINKIPFILMQYYIITVDLNHWRTMNSFISLTMTISDQTLIWRSQSVLTTAIQVTDYSGKPGPLVMGYSRDYTGMRLYHTIHKHSAKLLLLHNIVS